MALNVAKEVVAMEKRSVRELRQQYAEVFGEATECVEQRLADQTNRLANAVEHRRRYFQACPRSSFGNRERCRLADVASAGRAKPQPQPRRTGHNEFSRFSE